MNNLDYNKNIDYDVDNIDIDKMINEWYIENMGNMEIINENDDYFNSRL
jgi:hypothetical protein